MIYLEKGQLNTLVLNINNNSRDVFDEYTLVFTHIMSKETKSYTILLDDPAVYFQNIRYCTIKIDLSQQGEDLNYLGQYVLNIYGVPDDVWVFNGMAYLNQVDTAETTPFTQYMGNNDENENYIYIEENPTISVYSQELDFNLHPYNSIIYKCDGTTIQSCYSPDNQTNMTDLVELFNSNYPDPPNPSCPDPTYCYCWTDYGTYYDNGDGRIRCEIPLSIYNSLCNGGTITLDVIYD